MRKIRPRRYIIYCVLLLVFWVSVVQALTAFEEPTTPRASAEQDLAVTITVTPTIALHASNQSGPIRVPESWARVYTSVSAGGALLLLMLLALRELIAPFEGRWKIVRRSLYIAIVPLLVLFFLTVLASLIGILG